MVIFAYRSAPFQTYLLCQTVHFYSFSFILMEINNISNTKD